MNQVIASVQDHGALAVFLALFLKRMGLPVPAVPFLLLAGARGRAGHARCKLHAPELLGHGAVGGKRHCAGLVFHRSVLQLIGGLEEMGRASLPFVALAAVLYVGWLGHGA